jgi:REP-associated tyrosine transposase
MGRPLRVALGGYIYHVLNRGNGRAAIFHKAGDFEAFERNLAETLEHVPGMRLTGYCLPTTGTSCCGRAPTARLPTSCTG